MAIETLKIVLLVFIELREENGGDKKETRGVWEELGKRYIFKVKSL